MDIVVDISSDDRKNVHRVFRRFFPNTPKNRKEIFYDLCFCICAPQTTFVSNRKVIARLIEEDFYCEDIPVQKMHEIVRPARFYRNKTKYLIQAKKDFDEWLYSDIKDQLNPYTWHLDERGFRDQLVRKVKGMGMKAASHFCRNLGFMHVAIIDTHILKFLKLSIYDVNSLRKYREVEKLFTLVAEENNISVGELDALLWKRYSNTPWEEFVY